MNSKNTLPISEARKRIFDIAKDIQMPGSYYTLTENGKPKAVILSVQEFESWQETLEVIKDFPYLKKDMRDARKDLESGAAITLDDFLNRQTKKNSTKKISSHEVHYRSIKKSSKRS